MQTDSEHSIDFSPTPRRRCLARWSIGPVLAAILHIGIAHAAATLGLWEFDEGSGSAALDSSGNTNHGTVQGASWVSRSEGSALSFRGRSSDYVMVPHNASLAIASPFYVEAWIRARGTNHYGAIVDKHQWLGNGRAAGFTLYLTGGQLRFGTYCGTRGDSDLFAPGELRDNVWHHVMRGWDGASIYVFVDGNLAAEAPWTHPPALSTANLGIGKRLGGWGGTLDFEGEIDLVRLYGSPFQGGNVAGRVDELDASGRVRGPLEGCSISLDDLVLAATDAQGEFSLPAVAAGEHTLALNKEGYYPTSRSFTLGVNESRFESFQLLAPSGGTTPVAFDFRWPAGRNYLGGLPGALEIGCTVAWNGSPGSVRCLIGDAPHAATLTDLGNGVARAELKQLDIPDSLSAPAELVLEVTNGAGNQVTISPGIYFHPLPRLLALWFGAAPPWAVDDTQYDFSQSVSLVFWKAEVPGGIYESEASLGLSRSLSLDTLAGTAHGSLSGFGAFSHSMDVPGVPVEVLGEGRLDLGGAVDLAFQGLSPLVITPSWSVAFQGKAGLGVPVVVVVNVVAPGLGSSLAEVPGLGDVKLRFYLIGGLGLAGEYADGQFGDCFLGTTSLVFSGTVGLEAQLVLDMDELNVEAGVYVGATGTPDFLICPEFAFQGITFRGYAGVFASAWIFEWEEEAGVELRFEPNAAMSQATRATAPAQPSRGAWMPLGTGQRLWGPVDRPPIASLSHQPRRPVGLAGPGPSETAIVRENVSRLARPALWAENNETRVLYVTSDPAKPWHASTDLALATQIGQEPWSVDPVTSDLAAEFNPAVAAAAWGAAAAWERIAGDAANLIHPAEVGPLLEIVACFYDRQSGLWTEPVALTTNQVVDRKPVVVAWTDGAGVLWIQNQGGASVGTAASGDRVCFAATAGAGQWQQPVILWEGPQGVLDLSAVCGPDGVLYAAWVVDEDGDPATRADRELYSCTAFSRIWGVPVRLTRDAVEDADPSLAIIGTNPLFVWRSGGALTYAGMGQWNPRPVHQVEAEDADVPPTLAAIPGGAALVYPLPGSIGTDVMVCTYDPALDQWCAPRPLTADVDVEHSVAAAHGGADLVLACLRTQTIRTNKTVVIDGATYHLHDLPQPGRTDLEVWRYPLGVDPAAQTSSMRLDPPNPLPGATSMIHLRVENRGEFAVQEVRVAFFDGDPNAGGAVPLGATANTAPLLPGAAEAVSMPWVVPGNSGSHHVFALVEPVQPMADRDRSNNIASVWTVLPDLVVEAVSATSVGANHVALEARVRNTGTIPTTKSTLAWRLGQPDGSVIARQSLPVLKPGALIELSWLWAPPQRDESETWVAVWALADDDNTVREIDESNNQRRLSTRTVAFWVPRISNVRLEDSDMVALDIVAPSAVPTELEVEATDALANTAVWSVEPAANISRIGPSAFRATLPLPDGSRFYRVKLTPH